MKHNYVFDLWENIRQRILNDVENLPEDKREIVPRGFSNNIYWQIGHVLTSTDALVIQFAREEPRIPQSYSSFFKNGTKPSAWSEQPPDWETIVSQLKEQLKELRKTFARKLTEPGAVIDDVLQAVVGSIAHESIHSGMISAMVKALLYE